MSQIAFTTLLAFTLITIVGEVPALGGTALLLLCVLTVVNVVVLVLRKDRVGNNHFRTPTVPPGLGAISCAFLAEPRLAADVSFVPISDIGRLVSPQRFLFWMDTSAASVSCTFGHNSFQGVAFGILEAAI